jgi:hypothetical protein
MRWLAPIALVAAIGVGAAMASPRSVERSRTVPCGESIGVPRFPYVSSNHADGRYRLVLGAVSVPPSYLAQTSPTQTRLWPYFSKSGLVVRAALRQPVLVTVPRAWRNRDGDCMGQRRAWCLQLVEHPRVPWGLGPRLRLRGRVLSAVAFRLYPADVQHRAAPRGPPVRRRQALWIERHALVTARVRRWFIGTWLRQIASCHKNASSRISTRSDWSAEEEPRVAASPRDTPGASHRWKSVTNVCQKALSRLVIAFQSGFAARHVRVTGTASGMSRTTPVVRLRVRIT